MKAWPRIDELRSSGWSGAEQQFEPDDEEPLSPGSEREK